MSTTVYVRGSRLQRLGELDDYSSLKATVRTCDVGDWSITCPADTPMARALQTEPYAGVIVVRDGVAEPFLSGNAVKLAVKTLDDGREQLQATGVDDNDVLASRLALPAPAGGAADYDDHSGPAETVLRGFVDRNAGPSALAARTYPDLRLEPDLGRGPNVRGRPDRYDNLLDFMRDLAVGAGITFRVVQLGPNRVVRFGVPTDRTSSVVFGFDRANLTGYEYLTARATASVAYVGGQGDLAARQVLELAAATFDADGRREVFVDERNAPTDDGGAYLAQKGGEVLAAGQASSTLSVKPLEGPDARYGVDYDLDDLIAVRLASGAQVADRVSQVTLTVEGGQETLTPVVASEGANLSGVNLVQRLRKMSRSLTRIESRT